MAQGALVVDDFWEASGVIPKENALVVGQEHQINETVVQNTRAILVRFRSIFPIFWVKVFLVVVCIQWKCVSCKIYC